MNPQQQRKRPKQSPNNNQSNQSSFFLPSKLILPGLGLLAVIVVLQGIAGMVRSLKPNLTDIELNEKLSRSQMMAESPRFGLDDLKVKEPTVRIIFRDNAGEDGDAISFSLNNQPYSATVPLNNAGTAFDLPLKPGANLLAIYGTRDGLGGITFEANVIDGKRSTSTMTLVPFPEGETASFYIIRR